MRIGGSQTWEAVFLFIPLNQRMRSLGEGKMESMDIKELTETMNGFVRSKGWYAADSKRPQTPRNLAISLSLEASEVLEHFQWQSELGDKDDLADELADVTLYLLQLASVTGIDLEQAVLKKLETNNSRQWDTDSGASSRRVPGKG